MIAPVPKQQLLLLPVVSIAEENAKQRLRLLSLSLALQSEIALRAGVCRQKIGHVLCAYLDFAPFADHVTIATAAAANRRLIALETFVAVFAVSTSVVDHLKIVLVRRWIVGHVRQCARTAAGTPSSSAERASCTARL